jgi:hypothetical protein
MNSILGFDKLALNYQLLTPVVPVFFAVLLLTARFQAFAAGQPLFYADFYTLAGRMRV